MTTYILLVDDNGIQALSRKAILERNFTGIAIADSPQLALRLMGDAKYLDALKLVITDHLMPLMNGPEFVKELRRLKPELPVVVLSGMADAEEEYSDLDVTFRAKPFPPAQLIALTEEMLDEPATDVMSRTA